MATPNFEEMVFETIQHLDYSVLQQVANLIGIPDNMAGTKCGLLKVVLRRFSSVENSFEHCQEESKSSSTLSNDEKLHTFIKFKKYKISGTIGTPGQKEKLIFSSLISQISNRLKKGYIEHKICENLSKLPSRPSQILS